MTPCYCAGPQVKSGLVAKIRLVDNINSAEAQHKDIAYRAINPALRKLIAAQQAVYSPLLSEADLFNKFLSEPILGPRRRKYATVEAYYQDWAPQDFGDIDLDDLHEKVWEIVTGSGDDAELPPVEDMAAAFRRMAEVLDRINEDFEAYRAAATDFTISTGMETGDEAADYAAYEAFEKARSEGEPCYAVPPTEAELAIAELERIVGKMKAASEGSARA